MMLVRFRQLGNNRHKLKRLSKVSELQLRNQRVVLLREELHLMPTQVQVAGWYSDQA